MSLKKFLISQSETIKEEAMRENLSSEKSKKRGQGLRLRSGQATVEYFVLLTLLASLTIIGISNFFSKVQYNTDRVLQFGVDAWKQPVVGDYDTSGMSIHGDDSFTH